MAQTTGEDTDKHLDVQNVLRFMRRLRKQPVVFRIRRRFSAERRKCWNAVDGMNRLIVSLFPVCIIPTSERAVLESDLKLSSNVS